MKAYNVLESKSQSHYNGYIIVRDKITTKPNPRSKTKPRQNKTDQTTKNDSTNKKCSDICIQ